MAKSTKADIGLLYKKLALGPELRSEEPKGKYPKGSIKKVIEIFSAEMNGLMRVNAWFLLFAVPLFVVVYWYSSYVSSAAILGFNFMGNIGMGYPGGSDDAVKGLIAVYHAYQNVLYLVLPAMMIASIGFCGSFNCYKSYMWGEKVEKVTKFFFRGVKKNWWKYLIVITFDALIVLALGSMLLWFLELRALSAATAGHWVLLIFVFIAGLLILYVNMQLLPMMSELDVSFGKLIKNAIIFSIKMALFGLPLFIICLLPIGLFFVKSNFIGVMLGVVVLMFGFILYGLSFTAFSQVALDNVLTPLYMLSVAPKSEGRKSKKQKKSYSDNNKQNVKDDSKKNIPAVVNVDADKPHNQPKQPKNDKKKNNGGK